MVYRYGSHTVYKIEYDFDYVTKYRYKVLHGDVGQRVREWVRQTCEAFEIRILKGVVSKDHVHILVSTPQSWRQARSCVVSKDAPPASLLRSFRA